MVTRENFFDTLAHIKRVHGHWDVVDSISNEGDIKTLVDLYDRLGDKHGQNNIPDWAIRSIQDRIINLLTHNSGLQNAQAALKIAKSISNPRKLEHVLSRLATGQSADVLKSVLKSLIQTQEEIHLTAILVQECVLRNKISSVWGPAINFQKSLQRRDHPLSWLPLYKSGLESDFPFPRYAINGYSTGLSYPMVQDASIQNSLINGGASNWKNVSTKGEITLMKSAVQDWYDSAVAARFKHDRPIKAKAGFINGLLLPDLSSDPLTFRLEFMHPAAILNVLFEAASAGGAYGPNHGGAFGRLAAWKSLAGLCGLTDGHPFEEVEKEASQLEWGYLFANCGWFHDVAWDFAVFCLDPTHYAVGLIAATDTD